MKSILKISFLIFSIYSCASPQKALQNPSDSSTLCPNLGILDKDSLNSSSIFQLDDSTAKITALNTSSQTKVYDLKYFTNAREIETELEYLKYKNIYKEICNGEPKFEKQIAFVIKLDEARRDWDKINKKSLKSVIGYCKSAPFQAIKEDCSISKFSLLDQKVKDHLVSKFPFMKKVMDKEVIYTNGETSDYKLHELFRSTVLSKQMQTGKKMPLVLEDKESRIIWTVENNNIGVIVYFREYNGKVALDKIIQKRGMLLSTVAGQAVDFLAMGIFNESTKYPDDEDLDEDMIK